MVNIHEKASCAENQTSPQRSYQVWFDWLSLSSQVCFGEVTMCWFVLAWRWLTASPCRWRFAVVKKRLLTSSWPPWVKRSRCSFVPTQDLSPVITSIFSTTLKFNVKWCLWALQCLFAVFIPSAGLHVFKTSLKSVKVHHVPFIQGFFFFFYKTSFIWRKVNI